jgi:hypothetical protein
MGWSGIENGDLLRRASREFEIFLTIDRSIQHQQAVPASIALVTLHVPNNRPETVLPMASRILDALPDCAPGTHTVVSAD